MKAKIYVATICGLGIASVVGSASGTGRMGWECRVPMQFLLLLAFCIVGSGLKIKLPGIMGSLSVSYIFVLIGVLELSLGETLALGAAGAVAGSLWNAKFRPRPIQVFFNVGSLVVSSTGSWWAFRATADMGMDRPAVSPRRPRRFSGPHRTRAAAKVAAESRGFYARLHRGWSRGWSRGWRRVTRVWKQRSRE